VSALKFYAQVVQALEDIGAPYMMVGAFAGLAYGITRSTFDIDILVDLRQENIEALAGRFPPPRYYADPEMMRESTRLGMMYNIIDTEEGVKADLTPLSQEPGLHAAFDRRVRRLIQDPDEVGFQAWCARPEDIIIGKLAAWAEGESAKHPADIFDILIFVGSGVGEVEFDPQIVTVGAAALGQRALELWQALQKRARDEIIKRK
jgi:hypothetical protein